MQFMLDGQRRKNGVVNKCRTQISQNARSKFSFVLEEEASNKIVKNGIAKEFKALKCEENLNFACLLLFL